MLTINSHGVEISIAGYIQEMVRNPIPMPFFYFYFLYDAFIVIGYNKLCAALAMERAKPINQNN